MNQSFERYSFVQTKPPKQNITFLSNRCDAGYLDPANKSVNYFIIVQGWCFHVSKKIIESLNKIEVFCWFLN